MLLTFMSSPTRGMWIEISAACSATQAQKSHPPHGGCGLKSSKYSSASRCILSSPTRGMWIEIAPDFVSFFGSQSSPTRGMWIEIAEIDPSTNSFTSHPPHGGCGLKSPRPSRTPRAWRSSPTRGMWIEIPFVSCNNTSLCLSSPTRGMWIEILCSPSLRRSPAVIPHTGDVD